MGKPGRFAARRAILSVQPQAEDDAIAAGRGAEAALRGLMRDSHALKSARIFHSKRVPKVMGRASGRLPGGGGRFEIDLIVVTPRQLTAIEIKNWSGELRVENGRWLQKRRNGEDLDHGDVLALNSQKLDVLTAFLAAKSLRAPPLLSSRVMLWNKNLQLAPMLRDHPAVIERHALDGYLAEQHAPRFGARFLNAVMSLLLDGEAGAKSPKRIRPLGRWKMRKLHNALDRLSGFDHIELVGGRVLAGDLLSLQTKAGAVRLRKALKSGEVVNVLCKRGALGSFLTALFGANPIRLGGKMRRVKVEIADTVLFHAAGQPQPEPVPLVQINRLVWG